jgi:Cu/Ag efflux pump CusA
MTAFSFILGMLPLLVATGAGAASRRVLGTTVFAGMLAATLLGVLVIPMLYFVVQHASERAGRVFGRSGPAGTPATSMAVKPAPGPTPG